MFCEYCGQELRETGAACPACGAKTGGAPRFASLGSVSLDSAPEQEGGAEGSVIRASWTAWITPLRNMTAMKQLLMCLAVAILSVGLLMAFLTGEIAALWYVGGILTAIFIPLTLVGALIHWMFVGGKELYIITDRGVWRGPAKGAPEKLGGAFNALGAAHLLSGNLSAAGLSMMVAARVQENMAWRDVKEVTYKPGSRLIVLKVNRMNKIWMFCTKENYAQVSAMVKGYTGM